MLSNTLAGQLTTPNIPATAVTVPSQALETVSSLYRGMSNAFIGFVADMYSPRQEGTQTHKERHLYLALLVIIVLLVVNVVA
jgi:hypothetical protein